MYAANRSTFFLRNRFRYLRWQRLPLAALITAL